MSLPKLRNYISKSLDELESMSRRTTHLSDLKELERIVKDLLRGKLSYLVELMKERSFEFNVFFWCLSAGEASDLKPFPPIEGESMWASEELFKLENRKYPEPPTKIDQRRMVSLARCAIKELKIIGDHKKENSNIRMKIFALLKKLEYEMLRRINGFYDYDVNYETKEYEAINKKILALNSLC